MSIGDLHCEYFIPKSRLKKSIISLFCLSPLFLLLYCCTNAKTSRLKPKRNCERSKGPVIIYNYFHTSELFQNIIASNFFPISKIFISLNSR